MKRVFIATYLTAACLSLTGVAAVAQAPAPASADASVPSARELTPAKFTAMASQDGMAEVEMGKVAEKNAKSPQVRKFAKLMVHDHTKANTELKTLADRKQLPVATQLDAEHRQMLQVLSAKQGAEFDSAYMDHMAMAHATAIALFQNAANSTDTDVAGFAVKTLPTLKTHQQMVDNYQAKGTATTLR